MIRIIRKNKFLYIFGEPRNKFDLENSQLLYTFDDLNYDEKLINNLRPYKYLGSSENNIYKLELLDHLPFALYEKYKPNPIDKIKVEKLLKEILETGNLLEFKSSEAKIPEIIYTCDVWNYVKDIYGVKNSSIIENFIGLGSSEKELVKKIYRVPGNLKKLEIARNSNWETIFEFLPSSIQENLMFFGSEQRVLGKSAEIPEFKNPEEIGPKLPTLKEEIYKEFRLGEIIFYGANEVKDRLSKIYEKCNLQKTPKLKDLNEFFTMTSCWSGGKRGLRIDFRK